MNKISMYKLRVIVFASLIGLTNSGVILTEAMETSINEELSLDKKNTNSAYEKITEYDEKDKIVNTNQLNDTVENSNEAQQIENNSLSNEEEPLKWGEAPITVSEDGETVTVYPGEITKISAAPKVVKNAKRLILIEGTTFPEDSSKLFLTGHGIQEIIGLEKIDTSNVTNMSQMFSYMSALTKIDVTNFNTSNVIDMSQMFHNTQNLTHLDLSSFDTSKVTDMSNMFSYMYALQDLNLSNFDTSRVTDMENMFSYMYALQDLNLSNFNTSQVTDMSDMFLQVKKLQRIQVGSQVKLDGTTSFSVIGKNPENLYTGNWTLEEPQNTSISLSDEEFGVYDFSEHPGTYVWEKRIDKTSIFAKDKLTYYIGETFNPEDGFISATDQDGNNIPFNKSMYSTVEGSEPVDTKKAGIYHIKYSIQNSFGDEIVCYTDVHILDYGLELSVPETYIFGEVTLGKTTKLYWNKQSKIYINKVGDINWELTAKLLESTNPDFTDYLKFKNQSFKDGPVLIDSGNASKIVTDDLVGADFIYVDYSTVETVRTDKAKLEWTLTPSVKEIKE